MNENGTTVTTPPPNGQAGFQAGAGEGDGTTVTVPVAPTAPTTPVTQQQTPQGVTFTAEAVEQARAEGQAALRPQLEAVQQELQGMRQTAEQAAQAEAARQAQIEEDARIKREADMDAKTLLSQKELEWQSKFASIEDQLAQRDALLAKERAYSDLQAYKTQVMAMKGNDILPELRDLVAGSTPAEVDASVAQLLDRSASILANMAAATAPPQQFRGSTVTAPPNGPMEAAPGTRQFTIEQINNMSMSEYEQYRVSLMSAASQQARGAR